MSVTDPHEPTAPSTEAPSTTRKPSIFTTITVPIALRDRVVTVRDRITDHGPDFLPSHLRARWQDLQRSVDGRPRGTFGLALVVELMATAFDELLRFEGDAADERAEVLTEVLERDAQGGQTAAIAAAPTTQQEVFASGPGDCTPPAAATKATAASGPTYDHSDKLDDARPTRDTRKPLARKKK